MKFPLESYSMGGHTIQTYRHTDAVAGAWVLFQRLKYASLFLYSLCTGRVDSQVIPILQRHHRCYQKKYASFSRRCICPGTYHASISTAELSSTKGDLMGSTACSVDAEDFGQYTLILFCP